MKTNIIDQIENNEPKSNSRQNEIMGAYIMAAIEAKASFELYSYRIIDFEAYKARMDSIVNSLNQL